ncbi:tail tape measure protein [Sphingomonas sp.]
MDDGIDEMMVRVRADTAGFARDVAAMRASLEGPFEAGVDRAGRVLETTLLRAVRSGQLGFEDLGRVALRVMDAIAARALGSGLDALLGGGGRGQGGLAGFLSALISGAPGRATGGPVSPNRPYWVGERGPELFVPTAAGRVEPTPAATGPRDVRVAITINAPAGSAPAAMQQSSRQVARAVRAALADLD